ncbi:hypothetical protein Acr_28g0000170 [Actinidia rufa]|uniref:Uncharacterized protein n=1 Tax=Actinidia rufa TaxID=165716 RepID=A0A7J0H886_9ERIC|nr:hypothetical protein Acr_28g0000170 [Actinidia rufa]
MDPELDDQEIVVGVLTHSSLMCDLESDFPSFMWKFGELNFSGGSIPSISAAAALATSFVHKSRSPRLRLAFKLWRRACLPFKLPRGVASHLVCHLNRPKPVTSSTSGPKRAGGKENSLCMFPFDTYVPWESPPVGVHQSSFRAEISTKLAMKRKSNGDASPSSVGSLNSEYQARTVECKDTISHINNSHEQNDVATLLQYELPNQRAQRTSSNDRTLNEYINARAIEFARELEEEEVGSRSSYLLQLSGSELATAFVEGACMPCHSRRHVLRIQTLPDPSKGCDTAPRRGRAPNGGWADGLQPNRNAECPSKCSNSVMLQLSLFEHLEGGAASHYRRRALAAANAELSNKRWEVIELRQVICKTTPEL